MAIRVAIIGAGSVSFTRTLIRDILCVPELQDSEFGLFDVNPGNLEMVYRLCQRDISSAGLPAKVIACESRREAIQDANYVISFVRVGGLEAFKTDIDIPLKYGVDQCVGDTLAPGGIMYGQRTIPVILDICADIADYATDGCLFLNYSNPNAMNTWAANQYGGIRTIGLCHGVQNGYHQISKALGIPKDELDIICAGINHQTWYVSVKHNGRELTGELLEAFEKHPEYSITEKVRIDIMRRFGYFSTESSGHLSEYVPWYRKRPEEIGDWIDLSSWINGETGGYLRICEETRNWFEYDFPNWINSEPWTFEPSNRSEEHGSYIIESLETGRIYRGHFNVVNGGCITNLPADAVVEVPGYVDGNGVAIPIVGELPLGCAAVCNASINVQRLSVEAALNGDDFLLRQAMMMDPLTGACCNPPEIWQMVDEMLVAQAMWLPQYEDAVDVARERLGSAPPVRTRELTGIRLHTKTVDEMARDKDAASRLAGATDKSGN